MRLFLIILLLPFFSYSQSWTWVVHNDSLFAKYGAADSFYYTGAPIKGTLWQYVKGDISNNSSLSAALAAKGTSNFDGAYSSLSGKPDLTLKINVSDSAPMLLPYLRSNVAAATYQLVGTYATGTGSASNANTGDNAVNSLYSSLVSNATHTGDATGSTTLTVVKINGTSLAGLATGILKNTTGTGVPSIAAQADITALLGAASITNTMIANGAVANLSGTNTGDNSVNSTYANDFRTANFVAGTNYLAPNGSAASLTSFPTFNQSTTGSAAILTTSRTIGITGDITYTSPSFNGSGNVTSTATVNSVTGKLTSYNAISTVGNGVASEVAAVSLTGQGANIGSTTLYAIPASGAGIYRISVYLSVTRAATTSSTMPSTTIAYTDNESSGAHSTVTTATSTGNSTVTTFAQTTYILNAKASTNITYNTASFATSGATSMQYNLYIRAEAL